MFQNTDMKNTKIVFMETKYLQFCKYVCHLGSQDHTTFPDSQNKSQTVESPDPLWLIE